MTGGTLFDEPGTGRPRVRLLLAYDGTDFRGFAAQPDVRTVEGVLARALEKILRHDVDLTCAGRTDAGVHAWGQVVTFEADPGVDPWRLQGSLNSMLAPEIVVRASDLVGPDFDARHSAQRRHYRYTVVNRPAPDPFLARYAWWVEQPLDVRLLRLAADPFLGEHDFSTFCRKPRLPKDVGAEGAQELTPPSLVRRVDVSRWVELGDGVLRYEIAANAFCWQMVRSVVGFLVDVGAGRRTPGDVLAVLRSRDRDTVGTVAPPQGLTLWEVEYED